MSTDDLLEAAWGLIANAGTNPRTATTPGPDGEPLRVSGWENESEEWVETAEKWRDAYFGSLKGDEGDRVVALAVLIANQMRTRPGYVSGVEAFLTRLAEEIGALHPGQQEPPDSTGENVSPGEPSVA
jgi:hypothetical protein